MPAIEPIVTHVAYAGWDDHDYFGKKLFGDLAGSTSYSALLGFALGGRTLTSDESAMLDDAAATLALADPRIWPLKLCRLGSAYGRVIPGIVVGNLCFDGNCVGPLPFSGAAAFMLEIEALDTDDAKVAAMSARIERDKRLPGFGVPFRDYDERVVALIECVKRRGRDQLPHWKAAQTTWRLLKETKGVPPNIGSAVAAVLLDCGFRPEEIGPLGFALMQSVMLANAFEGAAQAPEVLRKLPDDCIDYVGKPARTSPRARASAAPQAGEIDRPQA
ncbi:MAG TPA: hypothetical protein VF407_02275 [Polyangiaceae bacterium]